MFVDTMRVSEHVMVIVHCVVPINSLLSRVANVKEWKVIKDEGGLEPSPKTDNPTKESFPIIQNNHTNSWTENLLLICTTKTYQFQLHNLTSRVTTET